MYAAPARRVPQPIPWTLCQMVGRDDNGDQRALLLTNSQLIERVSKGDQQAFRALYDENVDRIYRLAYRMAGEENLAQDFRQEAFLRAYQRLDQFRGDAAFSTWLHSIAVSVVLNGLRKVDRHRKRERSLEDAAHVAPDHRAWSSRAHPGSGRWARRNLQDGVSDARPGRVEPRRDRRDAGGGRRHFEGTPLAGSGEAPGSAGRRDAGVRVMSEQPMDRMVEAVREAYHAPGDTPQEAM